MTTIRDMLFVNTVEKQLGRKLSEEELAEESAFRVNFPDGHSEFIEIPVLEFPFDLLTRPEDYYESDILAVA